MQGAPAAAAAQRTNAARSLIEPTMVHRPGLREAELFDGLACAFQVGRSHLRPFARKDYAIGTGAKRCQDGIARATGRGFRGGAGGGDVDIDAGPELGRRARKRRARTGGLAVDVVGGEAGLRQAGQRLLQLVVHHAVVEVEQFLRRHVAIDGLADGADVAGHALTAAVVIHHHFQKVGVLPKLRKILLGAVNRAEGIVMPDVPAYADGGLDRFHFGVDGGIGFAQAVGPEHFPGEHLGVTQHDAPEGDVVAIHGALALAGGSDEITQGFEAGAGAVDIDAAGAGLLLAVWAKAGDGVRVAAAAAVRGAEHVGEGALAFGAPHNAVDFVAARVIFHGAEQPVPVVGVVEAEVGGIGAGKGSLLGLGHVGDAGAPDVFEPADGFHAALAGGGDYGFQHVEVAEIGRAEILDDGVLVVLRVNAGVAAALEGARIVFLLAVIGQGLAGDLAAGDAAAVGEGGDEEGVDGSVLLELVEDLFDAFIDEGYGTHLDANHFGSSGRCVAGLGSGGYRTGGRGLQKVATIHIFCGAAWQAAADWQSALVEGRVESPAVLPV